MNSFSKIRDWFNQFDGHTLKIGTENFVLEIPLNVANIPHLLGLQYMEVKDGVSLKANEAIKYIENNSLNDRQIFIKIHKQYRKTVLSRVATFKSFMENLDKGILVQNTHPSSKIRSDEFIIQIEDNKIFHLGLLNVGGVASINSFEENLSSSKVMETYFLKKQNNYFLNSSYAEEIKTIEIRKPQEKEYIPFSFDENKNKLLLEIYHNEKSQAKTLGEVAKEKAAFLVSETREGSLSSMLKFYKNQIKEEDIRVEDSVENFKKDKGEER